MVTLLAFVVLCGGTAYADKQLDRNTVGTKQLKRNAVTSAKVKDGSLLPRDFKGGLRSLKAPGPAFQAHGDVNYDKLSSSLYGSTVVSLALPAGSYYATAAVTVETVNKVGTDVACRLIDGVGGAGSQAAVMRSQSVRADGSNDAFTLTGAFQVDADEALNLQCSKGAAGASARITDASIVAVQVTGITGQAQ